MIDRNLYTGLIRLHILHHAAEGPIFGQAMIDDALIFPIVNPQLVLAYASDITGMHYSACCNLDLGLLGVSG